LTGKFLVTSADVNLVVFLIQLFGILIILLLYTIGYGMYPYIVYNIHLIADNKRYTYSYVIYIVHFDKFIHSVFRTNCRHGFHFISRRFSSSLGHSVHVTFSLHIGRSFFPTKHSIMPILGIFGPCPEFQCIPRILTAFLDH
jgi:hypothetical protein